MSTVRVQIGGFVVQCWLEEVPYNISPVQPTDGLIEQYGDVSGSTDAEGCVFCLKVNSSVTSSCLLTVLQRYSPCQSGFDPGVLLVPETGVIFVGAGERLLAYSMEHPVRLWEDLAEFGFLWWDRSDDVILMAAELGLAAWNLSGDKLWATFVEPPWSYSIDGRWLNLDVMGQLQTFDLHTGPG